MVLELILTDTETFVQQCTLQVMISLAMKLNQRGITQVQFWSKYGIALERAINAENLSQGQGPPLEDLRQLIALMAMTKNLKRASLLEKVF